MPPLSIRVVDNRKFGRKPVVGSHSISSLIPFKKEPLRPEAIEWRKNIEEQREAHRNAIARSREETPSYVVVNIPGIGYMNKKWGKK